MQHELRILIKFYEICALAMMLGVTTDDLSAPDLPTINRSETIDRAIRELRGRGWTYKRIAEKLGLPLYTCKDVGSGRHKR